jgi:hypothetical protein
MQLAPVRPAVHRGDDVITSPSDDTLLAAYLRAGRPAEARALLARRVERQPSVPVAEAR